MIVGLISDTHDLLRPEAVEALRGCELILHAGDVCNRDILVELESVAPVRAVRGNCDFGPWARALPASDTWDLEGTLVHAVHDLELLEIDPTVAGVRVVLYGHTHRPALEEREGVLYVNPGSAGPRRFRLPISVARMTLNGEVPQIELITLG